jgi:putative ABC transport system permease protein
MYKNYFKIALKVLLRRKMFTFISLFGICFTLTILLAATAVYTYKVISNPIEKNLSRTLFIKQVTFSQEKQHSMSAGPVMSYLIESSIKPLANTEMVAYCSRGSDTKTTYINNERVDIDTKQTDENFFKVLTFSFIEGRPYSEEEIEGGQKVAVICASLCQRLFGEGMALGKTITLNNETYRIIGVVKDIPKLFQTPYAQLWRPYNYASYMAEVQHKAYGTWAYLVMVVAKDKSGFDAIRAQFSQKISWLKPPDNFDKISAVMESSFDFTFGNFLYSSNFQIGNKANHDHLMRMVSICVILFLFLMIPLLNLTNLTVSRIFERASEIGVRKAFGATKRQMIGQFVYENLILTLLGGILGFGGAWLLLKGINSAGIMEIGSIGFSFRIVFYGFLVIVVFGIISGLYPALKMSKLQIVDTMKGGNK